MNRYLLFVGTSLALLLCSCSSSRDLLRIKTYQLGQESFNERGELLIRGEAQRILYGAVTQEERLDRVGKYFVVRLDRRLSKGGDYRVKLEYRQAKSGDRIHQAQKTVGHEDSRVVEFAIKGEAFKNGGAITSWRVSCYDEGGQLVDRKRSYLWK